MKFINSYISEKTLCFCVIYSILLTAISPTLIRAQTLPATPPELKSSSIAGVAEKPNDDQPAEVHRIGRNFRVEKMRVAGGAELITIFVNADNFAAAAAPVKNGEVPMVSVLRDTLGDETPENDRLRYVWMLNYTEPSLAQKFASGVPFLYRKFSNKGKVGSGPPPAVMDLNPSDKNMWDKIFWAAFKSFVLSQFDVGVRSSVLQFQQNRSDYKKAAMMRALAFLTLYESLEGEKLLNETEMQDIQARVILSDTFTGSFMQKENLSRVYEKNLLKTRDYRARNWELLRQYTEAQSLYFDPLEMPDGSATHAIVWIDEAELKTNRNKKFDSRFLNIKNPWKDKRLTNWKGYKEVRYYDDDNHEVAPETPNAKARTLIPLALYGLDYPKIPAILIDFRSNENPRFREVSKRVLDDVTRNVLSVSKFGNLPYFFGRYVYDFVLSRRGIDYNQTSRLNSYAQLKLLLLLDESLDENFKKRINSRLGKVSVNPLENDTAAEIRIARRQYENLVAYAKRPDGLPKKLEKDRREEMVRLRHGGKDRMLYAAAHLFSLGLYTHRETATPELFGEMSMRRRLEFHDRILRETARDSARPEVDSDVEAVKKSLAFIAEYGQEASGKTARAVAKIFQISEDQDIRTLALSGLNRMANKTAKAQLLAIYENQKIDSQWRNISAQYLKLAPVDATLISSDETK